MELPDNFVDIVFTLIIPVGIFLAFLGYRMFKLALATAGFLVGAMLASFFPCSSEQTTMATIFLLISGGLIGASLAVVLHFVGVFLSGALLGSILGNLYLIASAEGNQTYIVFVAAIILGILALIFEKFMIIISTSFGGAWLILVGALHFTMGSQSDPGFRNALNSGEKVAIITFIIWFILGGAGTLYQYRASSSTETENKMLNSHIPDEID